MGRSLVFFSKKLDWSGIEIDAFEGDGSSSTYTTLNPRSEESFFGSIPALQSVLKYNEIRNVKIFDARQMKLVELPGPYDLIYSFYSIGFHWVIEQFLDDLLPLMHERSVGLFTVPENFQTSPRLETLPHRILDFRPGFPKDARYKILVLGKGTLPTW
jgi:hypothetical protein